LNRFISGLTTDYTIVHMRRSVSDVPSRDTFQVSNKTEKH